MYVVLLGVGLRLDAKVKLPSSVCSCLVVNPFRTVPKFGLTTSLKASRAHWLRVLDVAPILHHSLL